MCHIHGGHWPPIPILPCNHHDHTGATLLPHLLCKGSAIVTALFLCKSKLLVTTTHHGRCMDLLGLYIRWGLCSIPNLGKPVGLIPIIFTELLHDLTNCLLIGPNHDLRPCTNSLLPKHILDVFPFLLPNYLICSPLSPPLDGALPCPAVAVVLEPILDGLYSL